MTLDYYPFTPHLDHPITFADKDQSHEQQSLGVTALHHEDLMERKSSQSNKNKASVIAISNLEKTH